MSRYCNVLNEFDVHFRETNYWASVGEPEALQGWKLHVSTIPVDAERLLRAVLPYLRAAGARFKIARDCSVLESLNAGRLGPTQVGKFMTIYPRADSVLEMAEHLKRLTENFRGPAVPTDLRLGEVLFARYGAFLPQIKLDRLGIPHRQIQLPDGSAQDDVYHVPHRTPDGVTNPFAGFGYERYGSEPRSGSKLFGPGYLIVDVIRDSPKGSTFLAICMKNRESVNLVVLKQARRHCMSDRFGRDASWRLKRELGIYQSLGDIGGIPMAREYFEVDGNGYIALDHVEGRNIEEITAEALRRRPWAECEVVQRLQILDHLAQLLHIVESLHARGYVHRDLNNTNVRICTDGRVVLLDFEMAHRVADPEPIIGLGTTGFASPQQEAGLPPDYSDDVYSLASVIVLTLTGIDPRRILYAGAAKRAKQILQLTGEPDELHSLASTVARGLDPEPNNRPALAELQDSVLRAQNQLAVSSSSIISGGVAKTRVAGNEAGARRLLDGAVRGILNDVQRTPEGLWLSLPLGAGDQGIAISEFELLRGGHSGVAGVVYTLALLARFGWGTNTVLAERTKYAVSWLIEGRRTRDERLPGLHFGEAGVAVALHQALASGLTNCSNASRSAVRSRLPGVLDWPDLTHGAAGQGLAALTAAPDLAVPCAEYLVRTQQPDGSWTVPQGLANVSGQKLTGFAHGTAGIVYFLAEFAQRGGDTEVKAAMRRGIGWLSSIAIKAERNRVVWPYSDRVEKPWSWWCHGSPGIALAYLRVYEATRDESFLAVALQALDAHPEHVRYGNLSYCHGLSGLGEIYLEAYRLTRDENWLARAHAILVPIMALARETDSGATWVVEDPRTPVADLGLGCCGVAHFLLRLLEGPGKVGLPLLPAPLALT
jgi:serine/threonine protein kinase